MSDEEKAQYLIEARTFTAEVHANFIVETFNTHYEIDEAELKEKLVNKTSDSVAVNVKFANILKIPHIGYYNHQLYNQVEEWLIITII